MRLRTLCAPILALGLIAPLARGAQSPTSPEKLKNAALEYWPLFAAMEALPEADMKIIEDWRHVPLDEKAVGLISTDGQYRTSFQYLHTGAQAASCDWGLDFSQGPYLLLRYLNYGNRLGRRGCLRIRYDLQQKHPAAAVEDTRDVLMLARNLAHDPLIIVRLVRFGIEREAIDAIAMGVDRLDAESLKQLSAMLDGLPPAATEADALEFESQVIPKWAIGKIAAAGAHPDWQTIFGFMQASEEKGVPGESADAAVKAAGGTPEGVTKALRDLLAYYEQAEKLVSTPASQDEFRPKAEALRHRFDSNPFAKSILPNLPAAHDAEVAAESRIVLLKAAIAVVQRGPDAVKDFQDPVNHQPIAYQKTDDRFQLVSKVLYRNEPVILTVGQGK
jgi:hypothetical protein